MEPSKLPHSIIGAVVSVISASASVISWLNSQGVLSGAAFVVAIISAFYSIQASRDTSKLRKRQLKDLGDE